MKNIAQQLYKISYTILLLTILAFSACKTLKNENDVCSLLKVKNMTLLKNNKMNVEIYYGKNENHLNYPYVSAVINSKGDTIAKGEMNFYAILPQTSQVFNLQVQPNQTLSKGKYKLVFIFDSKCMLNFEK
jgi:hypothetical protein